MNEVSLSLTSVCVPNSAVSFFFDVFAECLVALSLPLCCRLAFSNCPFRSAIFSPTRRDITPKAFFDSSLTFEKFDPCDSKTNLYFNVSVCFKLNKRNLIFKFLCYKIVGSPVKQM